MRVSATCPERILLSVSSSMPPSFRFPALKLWFPRWKLQFPQQDTVVSTVGYWSFHGRILEYLHRDTGFPIVVDPAFNSSPLTVCLIDTLLNSCRTQVWQIPASATYLPHYLQRSNLFYIRQLRPFCGRWQIKYTFYFLCRENKFRKQAFCYLVIFLTILKIYT